MHLKLRCGNINLEDNAFYGLYKLIVLDLSHSVNIYPQELMSHLNIKHLENLRNLILVQTGTNASVGFDMGEKFWKFIGHSRISLLDTSDTNIRSFNVTSYYKICHKLLLFRTSRARFTTVHASMQRYPRCIIHSLVSEDAIINTIKLYCPNYQSYVVSQIAFQLKYACIFPKAKYFHFEIVCLVNGLSLLMDGISLKPGFQLLSQKNLNISQLTLNNNDLQIICSTGYIPFISNSTLESLTITHNEVGLIAPDAISHITTLVQLDLSYNNLQEMNKRYRTLFTNVLSTFSKLRCIILVRNVLTDIPEHIFLNNYGLEQIILTDNYILKVTFKIAHLKYLKYLDLRDNRIRVLESSTLSVLQSLFESHLDNITIAPRELNVNKNPLSCCDNTFIKWLRAYSNHIVRIEDVTCMNEHGAVTNVVNKTLDRSCTVVDAKEESVYKNIAIVAVLVLAPLLLCVSVIAVRHYLNKRKKKRVVKDNALTNINYGYVVFLSFSSEDDLFIDTRVMQPLEQCLRTRINNEIKPVGTGDTMFRAGMYIHDEIISCLEQSKVMIILLTDHYCRSECCVMEFQRAIQLNKPIIIMVKDKVDKTLLTPAMRMCYNTNSRIIWTKHDGDYVLKSTWDTICDSIMELGDKARPKPNADE